jgi:hypothetical protein
VDWASVRKTRPGYAEKDLLVILRATIRQDSVQPESSIANTKRMNLFDSPVFVCDAADAQNIQFFQRRTHATN